MGFSPVRTRALSPENFHNASLEETHFVFRVKQVPRWSHHPPLPKSHGRKQFFQKVNVPAPHGKRPLFVRNFGSSTITYPNAPQRETKVPPPPGLKEISPRPDHRSKVRTHQTKNGQKGTIVTGFYKLPFGLKIFCGGNVPCEGPKVQGLQPPPPMDPLF